MGFKGWPEEALDFYEGLEADNSKTYWHQHNGVYEDAVRRPLEELLAELAPQFGEGKIFRPYRDVRFAADKAPYKTAIGATLSKGGYIELSSSGLGCGSGYYVMAPDQLERYRRAVDDDTTGRKLERVVAKLGDAKIEVSGRDVLKTAPKGYPKEHARIDLLRMKGLIAWKQWPAGAWLGKASAKERIVEFLRAAKPLGAWLDTNVGPSTLPMNRR